jgi:hypothetical protein
MESHFVIIFDISRKHPDWKMLMVPVLFILISMIGALWELLTKRRFKYLMAAGILGLVGFVVGYGFYKDSTYGLAEAESALKNGRFSVVEGRVNDFVPMPLNGHAYEQLTVHGVHFSYSDFEIHPCFNNTSSHGGPIRKDMWVRLSYEGNCILRIEEWQSVDMKPGR